jgi:hypothetical protein
MIPAIEPATGTSFRSSMNLSFHLAPQAVCGCGKVGILLLDFHFSMAASSFCSPVFVQR